LHWQQAQTAQSQDANDSDQKVDNSDVDDEDEDEVDDDGGGCFIIDHVTKCRSAMMSFYDRRKSYVKTGLRAVLVVLYFVYFGYAVYYDWGDEPTTRLVSITCAVVAVIIMSSLFSRLRPKFESISLSKPISYVRQYHRQINWFVANSYESIRLLVMWDCGPNLMLVWGSISFRGATLVRPGA